METENTELAAAEETVKAEEPSLCRFEFNVTIPEEDDGFKVFQKRYVFKRNVIKSIGFGILGIGFLINSIFHPDQAMNFILMAVCAAAVVMIWYNNVKIRRSLMEALKMLEDDRYIFTLFSDRFRIETIVPEEERAEEDFEEIPPQEFELDDPLLDAVEKDDKFIVIVKKATIYVLPKRCMDDEQIKLVRDKFKVSGTVGK